MKTKIVTSVVFALLLCSFLAYNSEMVKADSEKSVVQQFAGNLYSQSGCGTQLLDGVSYVAENRTTGFTQSGITKDGAWHVNNAYTGNLIKVTFTQNGKVGCLLQEQSSTGYNNLQVCMTKFSACQNEW